MDAPGAANSGHSGTAMALAPLAHVLWTRVMRYDPRDPEWPDRDRFVLSNGHASILLYSMLYLTGYDLSLDDLRQFRQWGSRTPGHPERRHTAGVEVTTGPLGQGFANARGHGDRRALAADHVRPEVCDHHTYVIAGDGCFMEGISHEAASLAGHLGLGRLVYVYDDNHITIDGPTELAYDDNVAERFEAYGWPVDNLGEMANDVDGLEAAIGEALDEPARTRRQADPPRAAQPHRLALAPPHRHREGPRRPVRRRGDPGDQGDPRPAARRDVLGPRRGARLLRPAHRRAARAQTGGVDRALRRLGRRPGGLGRRAGRPRAAGLGRRSCPASRPAPTGHPQGHQPVPRRHGEPSSPGSWPAPPTSPATPA